MEETRGWDKRRGEVERRAWWLILKYSRQRSGGVI
jgi:hypothetical protein